jgi:hypothetical protein
MNTQQTLHQHTQSVSLFTKGARKIYALGATLFAASIVLQVFFAGLGVLVSAQYWGMHAAFGFIVGLFPLVLLPIGMIARLPWRLVALTALAFVLFVLQFVFLWVAPQIGLPLLRALHAVNALAMFWLALDLSRQAWQAVRTL